MDFEGFNLVRTVAGVALGLLIAGEGLVLFLGTQGGGAEARAWRRANGGLMWGDIVMGTLLAVVSVFPAVRLARIVTFALTFALGITHAYRFAQGIAGGDNAFDFNGWLVTLNLVKLFGLMAYGVMLLGS